MPLVTSRFLLINMRRLSQFILLTCSVMVLLTMMSKWSTPHSTETVQHRPTTQSIREEILTITPKMNRLRTDLPKYIHLDLKGAPPKAQAFYPNFFQFIDQLQMGVKGIVIEYEDMLPLDGRLANTTNRLAYNKEDIALIQRVAQTHRLEVIPLIQTFGHLEWLLKLREFELFRDDLNSPMVITPCLDTSYLILESLLQQTLELHPNSNIIHIGCDEVILTNSHPQCQEKWMDVPDRYVDHIKRVVNIVRKYRPGIRILIWDDVIRSDAFINNEPLLSQLKDLVEPVAWHYRPSFEESYIGSPAWKIYAKLFPHTWAASAFKGGLNRMSMQTNTTHHVLNHRAWLQFIESPLTEQTPMYGLIMTGWSRFDHFMPLCDLFPTSYESLVSSLQMINTGQFIVNDYTNDCEGLMNAAGKDTQLCQFVPGVSIWSSISSLSIALAQIEERLLFLHTVAPSYSRLHLFVRRYELDSRLTELQALQNNLFTLSQILQGHFSEIYTPDVTDEWLSLYVAPMLERINRTLIAFQPVRNQTSWPRRPLI